MAFDIYYLKFKDFNLSIERRTELLEKSEFYQNSESLLVPKAERFDVLVLTIFFKNSKKYIDDLILKDKMKESLEKFIFNIKAANGTFDLTNDYIESLLSRIFVIEKNEIVLKDVYDMYQNSYTINIKYNDFLKITMDFLIYLYSEAEKNLNEYFIKMDFKQCGCITFDKLEELLVKILDIKGDNWKVLEAIK